jgi:hypothetical protein
MSSEIMLRDASAPSDSDSDLKLRWENTVNAPVNSATWLDDGEAFSDVYTITATSGSAVNVVADDPKNDVEGNGISVVADDATVNYGVVPGVGIVFSSSLANGWAAKVSIGALMASDGSTSARLNIGTVEAGSNSTQRRIAAVNVGSNTSSSTKVYALPGAFIEDAAQPWVTKLDNHTDPSRHDLATEGDFAITFADYQSGTPDTADVLVDGTKAIEDAQLDGTTLYQYGVTGYIDAQDKFKGLGIILADNGDPTSQTLNFYVRKGYESLEFAPDVSGSPGTWQSGPLDLTESGETTGTITAGGIAYFWVRANPADSESPGDRRLYNYRVRGLTV